MAADSEHPASASAPEPSSSKGFPWRRWLKQGVAVVLTLSITSGMVAYSAMIAFDVPTLRPRRIFTEDDPNTLLLAGRVESSLNNLRIPHDDAIALLWPTEQSQESLPLDDRRTLPNAKLPPKFVCTRVGADGMLMVTQGMFSSFASGDYYVLVLSLSQTREQPPTAEDLQLLARSITNADDLLGQLQYRLEKVSLDLAKPAEVDFYLASGNASN